jgi:hypothetical protein
MRMGQCPRLYNDGSHRRRMLSSYNINTKKQQQHFLIFFLFHLFISLLVSFSNDTIFQQFNKNQRLFFISQQSVIHSKCISQLPPFSPSSLSPPRSLLAPSVKTDVTIVMTRTQISTSSPTPTSKYILESIFPSNANSRFSGTMTMPSARARSPREIPSTPGSIQRWRMCSILQGHRHHRCRYHGQLVS